MQNNLEADGAIQPPLKKDGQKYQFCMYFENNKNIIFSDDLSQIIARLIPGYDRLDADQQNAERREFLETNFHIFQTNLIQAMNNLDNSELAEILKSKTNIENKTLMEKYPNILLVISETPQEGIINLQHGAEISFLQSLHNVGYISFFSAD